MDENKNLNQGTEDQGTGANLPGKGKKKTRCRIKIRNPFYKEELPAKEEASAEGENGETTPKDKPRWKERLSDVGKGVLGTLFVLGVGAVAYAKHAEAKEKENTDYVDVSDEDDDSEENRIMSLPPVEDEEEEEDSKEKETEEIE